MLFVRKYGMSGPLVIALHGGPGAAGHMAPVARGLADLYRVLEPFQRGSGGEALSVARHVDDLHELVNFYTADAPPALLGSSWVQCSLAMRPPIRPQLRRSSSSDAAPSIWVREPACKKLSSYE